MNERELRLVRRIVDSLRAIQQDIHAIHEQHSSGDDEEEPPPERDINAHVSLPVPISDYYTAENRDSPLKVRRDRIRLAVEMATLIAVVIAGFFAYRSFREVKRQADAAQRQLDHSIESFRIDERAWIEIEPPKPVLKVPSSTTYGGALFTYDFFLKNVGRTAAFNIAVKASRSAIDAGLQFGDNRTAIEMEQKRIMAKNVFPGISPNDEIILLSERNSKTLGPGVQAFSPFNLYGQEPRYERYRFLMGRIDYEDAFYVAHWSTFCFYIDTGGALRYCQEGNEEDRNPETEPATKK